MKMINKNVARLVSLVFFLNILSCKEAAKNTKTLHVIKVDNGKDVREFFEYTGNGSPILSGHRGQTKIGYTENSLEAMENVLEHTPAFFEVDPRLSKDSVIVLMHDATLDRTTNGVGKVSDYTLAELKKMRLKDAQGNVTEHQIPTLEEAIKWSKGKTILNLDKKDVPISLMAETLEKYDKETTVMLTVHSAEQALFYHSRNKDRMFSAFIKTKAEFQEYDRSGVPWSQMIAYIGPKIKGENNKIYELLNAKGVMCMISAASSYDKLERISERKKSYIGIMNDGASIIESDYPIDVFEAIKDVVPKTSPRDKYFQLVDVNGF